MVDQFELSRAGFLNFWYYDTQVFQFADGKLLLRGSNGSGKSVTMQSLVPVLLDGRTSPDRLDPFGSRARRMDDYLLGEVSDREERTGYLWLEFKRRSGERYITCGIGLRARRHASLEFWGFVITDNRRIGRSFELHKFETNLETGKEEPVPLSRRELTNRLQLGGRVVENRREYMELVNRHVFGFEHAESYEELIKLLIQLRSPKLSKDFRPTVIYEILNASLPPLSEDELRPLAETIENMDQIKQQVEQLRRDEQAMQSLASVYDAYSRFQLASLAKNLLTAEDRCGELQQQDRALAEQLQTQQMEIAALQDSLAQLQQEQATLDHEQQQLQSSDVFAIGKQHDRLEQDQRNLLAQRLAKQGGLDGKLRKERELSQLLQQQAGQQRRLENEINDLVEDLAEFADAAAFLDHAAAIEHWRREQPAGDYDFGVWKEAATQHSGKLDKVLQALKELDSVSERYREADAAHAEASRLLDDKLREQNQLVAGMDRQKESYLADFDAWRKGLLELQLTEDERLLVARCVMDIYQPHLPAVVAQPVEAAANRRRDQISQQIAEIRGRVQRKGEEIGELEVEIRRWREQPEPEPARHPDTAAARQALDAAGVPHLPFYAAVEFQDGISQEERERTEAAISEAGLLDALIVPARHLAAVSGYDKVIMPAPQLFTHTLADILQPVPSDSVDSQSIDDVLRSVLRGVPSDAPGAIILGAGGRYRIALLSGQAPRTESARYIGREARRRYREEKLRELECRLGELRAEQRTLLAELEQANGRLNLLKRELDGRPVLIELEQQWLRLSQVEAQLKVWRSEVERKQRELAETHRRLVQARNNLQRLMIDLNLQATEPALVAAISDMRTYQSRLHQLELRSQALGHALVAIRQYQTSLQDACDDVDELKGEINQLEAELSRLAAEISGIERRLVEMGAADIHARIKRVIARLHQLPAERETAASGIARLQGEIGRGNQDRLVVQARLTLARPVEQGWQQMFAAELSLGSQPIAVGENLLDRARQVVKQVSSVLQQTDRERMAMRLNDAYYREQGNLLDYRPTLVEQVRALDLPELLTADETGQSWLNLLGESRQRKLLTLEYQGRKTDVFNVQSSLRRDVLEQEQLLEAKDRQLYEEIILHSVGDMIRRRINRAEQWVQKISRLMEQRDTSSGLTFSLVWQPRTAECEDELDTKDLVDLLRLDPGLLKDADSERITSHFRSQIDRAKAELAERRQGETFQAIVQELLDYRRWFDFKLFFRKEGAPRRELTDRIFFTFSGGEKAMAMYIPLFSAAYSRYQEAREDAPRLITLDEAFAGVDETNIRDMFGLMEQLGFNYIINSQALWGDYDTAGRLAIGELVRPKNAPYVTVVPYLWDGQAKHLLAALPEVAGNA